LVSVPRTAGAGSRVVLPNEVQGLSSRVGDFAEIAGLRPIEVIERIPKSWVVDMTAKEGGLIFRPADAALAKYNHVRIMVDPKTGMPYARVLKNGSYVDNAGQKITDTTTANKAASGHIPLSW
jgi:hypothetical protein